MFIQNLKFSFAVSQEELFKISGESPVSMLFKLPGIRKFAAEYAFESASVQKILQRNDLNFDLVINEEFFQESFSMFAYKYKAPLVTISKYNCKNKIIALQTISLFRHLWKFRFL